MHIIRDEKKKIKSKTGVAGREKRAHARGWNMNFNAGRIKMRRNKETLDRIFLHFLKYFFYSRNSPDSTVSRAVRQNSRTVRVIIVQNLRALCVFCNNIRVRTVFFHFAVLATFSGIR